MNHDAYGAAGREMGCSEEAFKRLQGEVVSMPTHLKEQTFGFLAGHGSCSNSHDEDTHTHCP
jgi:hypothetical protein